jgi:hypothetical protein
MYYHRLFSQKCGIDSIEEIHQSIKIGAVLNVSQGLFARNDNISKSEKMIAFGFGEKEPTSSGTKHTWKKCKATGLKDKVYIPIQDLLDTPVAKKRRIE